MSTERISTFEMGLGKNKATRRSLIADVGNAPDAKCVPLLKNGALVCSAALAAVAVRTRLVPLAHLGLAFLNAFPAGLLFFATGVAIGAVKRAGLAGCEGWVSHRL